MLAPPPAFPDERACAAVRTTLQARLAAGERSALGRVLAEGEALPESAVRDACAGAYEAFRASGLLVEDGGLVRATVQLQEHAGRLFASDRRELHRAGAAQFVLGVGPVTARIASLLPLRAGARVLDVGCGCGVLAVLAAAQAQAVTALDLNPRALAFTRFNAQLNGCDNIETLEGDLYAPVTGRQFDVIVSNAPYVISPDTTFLYRDGGRDLCERLARATPAHLAPDGCALLAVNWPEHDAGSWQGTLAGWVDGSGCDLWVLSTEHTVPDGYARLWLMQQYPDRIPPGEIDRWTAAYAAQRIVRLHGGYLVMHRPRARDPWIEFRDLPPFDPLAGRAIDRVLAARDLAASHDDSALLEQRLTPIPGLLAIERRVAGPAGWQVQAVDLRPADGLRLALRVDPLAAELIGWFDGTRSVATAVRAFAQARALDAAPLLQATPPLLRRLLDAGLLVAT
jgi:SAM-dependent methyltransferase